MVEILFARKSKEVIIPAKRTEDAGYDIYAYFEEEEFVIPPHFTVLVPTGLYSFFSSDYVLLLEERGSTGSIGLKRSAGVIDSGFRNEIFVCLTNTNDVPIIISKNVNKTNSTESEIYYPYSKAITQGLLLPVPTTVIKEISVEELQAIPSNRGLGMLGSSCK